MNKDTGIIGMVPVHILIALYLSTKFHLVPLNS